MASSCAAAAPGACADEVGSRGSPPMTFTLVAPTRSSHHNSPAAAPAASFNPAIRTVPLAHRQVSDLPTIRQGGSLCIVGECIGDLAPMQNHQFSSSEL